MTPFQQTIEAHTGGFADLSDDELTAKVWRLGKTVEGLKAAGTAIARGPAAALRVAAR